MYGHAVFVAKMGFEVNHQPSKEMLIKHVDSNAHISAVQNVPFRGLAQRVLNNWKLQENTYKKLSYCMRSRIRTLVLGENYDQVPLEEAVGAKLLALELMKSLTIQSIDCAQRSFQGIYDISVTTTYGSLL